MASGMKRAQWVVWLLVLVLVGAGDRALAAPVDTLLIGDSITRGFDPVGDGDEIDWDGDIHGGWRAPLYVKAHEWGIDLNYLGREDTGPSTVEVNGQSVPFDGQHEGHNGARIDTTLTSDSGAHSILDRLPDMFDTNNGGTDAAEIDYIFLSIGINDVRDREDNGLSYDSTDSRYTPNRLNNLVSEIKNILDSAGNLTAKLMVSNVLPVRDEFSNFSNVTEPFGDELNQDIITFNTALADFFDGNGAHLTLDEVYLLDPHSIINADRETYIHTFNADDNPDYLHMTVEGNQALADYYATVIPEPGTLALFVVGAGLLAFRPRRGRASRHAMR